ncbi:actin-like family protein [Besnoitia besnoiti]|uniref:Actin-like family protein n=1 Tax=Besnoitia besnoiti TaxID=94643 RepID=A0A2A9MIW9_BESBE|nr:actin-like family protein [Besnoitia besnoiti]PFH35593.1 actin-like family protein [Besnoitia besnoiti]
MEGSLCREDPNICSAFAISTEPLAQQAKRENDQMQNAGKSREEVSLSMGQTLRRSLEAEYVSEAENVVVVILEIGTSEIRTGFAGDETPQHRLPAFLSRTAEASPSGDLHAPLTVPKTFVGDEAFAAAARAAGEAAEVVRVFAAHPRHPLADSADSYENLFVIIDAALEKVRGGSGDEEEDEDDCANPESGNKRDLPSAEMPWALLALVPVVCDQRLASCLLRWSLETRGAVFGAVKLVADVRMAAYHHLSLLPEDQRSAEQGLLMVDAGEAAIRVVPVCGWALTPWTHALHQTDTGAGSLLTSLVLLHQDRRGEGGRGTRRGMSWRDAARYKEERCFVSVNPAADLQLHRRHRQLLPPFVMQSGAVLQPSAEAFLYPEIFFTPQLLRNANLSPVVNSTSQSSLSHIILDAFGSGTVCERARWLSRLCLVGGTAKLPNFATRLEEELRTAWQSSDTSAYMRRKDEAPICLHVSSDPQLAAFRGASAFGRVAVLDEDAWISREEYETTGSVSALARRALYLANKG